MAEGADGAYVEFGSGEKPPAGALFGSAASLLGSLHRLSLARVPITASAVAGVVLDLVSTSRVKAWGPHMRRKKCEELASDAWRRALHAGRRCVQN